MESEPYEMYDDYTPVDYQQYAQDNSQEEQNYYENDTRSFFPFNFILMIYF